MLKEAIFAAIALTLIYAALITLPVSSTHSDIFFTVTVENNIFNNPTISDISVYTKPASILPSSYTMASLFQSGTLSLSTTVGDTTITKQIGTLDTIDTPFTTKSHTVSYRVPHVENPTAYTISLIENMNEIDKKEGAIT
ncbi:MAG: hypothetical protein KAS32_31495 [Candidatus Peribacteraceae bacterium]|nr:hypothetical protein [Candidatus Peribacteraceae bacterium]